MPIKKIDAIRKSTRGRTIEQDALHSLSSTREAIEPGGRFEDGKFLVIWETGHTTARDKDHYDLREKRSLPTQNPKITKLKPYEAQA